MTQMLTNIRIANKRPGMTAFLIVAMLLVASTGFGQGIAIKVSGNKPASFVSGSSTYAHRNVTNAILHAGKSDNTDRVEYIMPDGLTIVASKEEGFVVLNNDNETLQVAVITGLDGSDAPAAYTEVLQIAPAAKENAAVFVRYSDLGLKNGTIIYGHTVFANNAAAHTVAGIFQVSEILAPIASDVTRPAVSSASGTAQVNAPALNATDLNIGGLIASYKMISVPSVSQGILYYNNGSSYAAVSEGMTLTSPQAASLKFDAADGYMGTAVFQYIATNSFGLTSNVAFGTIPVYTVPTANGSSKVNLYKW